MTSIDPIHTVGVKMSSAVEVLENWGIPTNLVTRTDSLIPHPIFSFEQGLGGWITQNDTTVTDTQACTQVLQTDERAYDGKLYDVYEIDGEAGDTLSVTLESDDFDTVVYVSNPDGTNLGRNDDGNDGTNSELIVRLFESGTHKVYVTALSDDSGDYTLTIFK